MNAAQLPVKQGEILAGKYRVERVLGMGGMGVVVAATHLDLLELRALKLMLPSALPDGDAVERFLREARATSRLRSEHVARVYDFGRLEDGAPYIVMECLQGADLSATLKRVGALHYQLAIRYVLQTAEALAEAHGRGIVHRDLKPANLFLSTREDGTPCIKVLDFGISKVPSEAGQDVTQTSALLGSPHYMSPEQMRSARAVDARSDIWSLGVILYQLVTGQLPFGGNTIPEIVSAVLERVPPRPSELVRGIPPGLDPVILRCLEREPDRRYANVGELAEGLLAFAAPGAGVSVDRILRSVASPSRGAGGSPPTEVPGTVLGSATGAWGSTSAKVAPSRARAPLVALAIAASALAGGIIAWNLAVGARSAPAAPGVSTTRDASSAIERSVPAAIPPPTTEPPSPPASASAAASDAPLAPSAAAPTTHKGTGRRADPFGMDRK